MKAGILRAVCALLTLLLLVPLCLCPAGCAKGKEISMDPPKIAAWGEPERIPNDCAECFALYRYENGNSAVVTGDGAAYLIADDPERAEKDAPGLTVLPRSPERVYLAATAVMSFFDALDALPSVRFSSLEAEGWTIDGARERMESGEMLYAGRYREPDYERLLSGGCDLSIQSTMSEHVPKVREKLEELGIPVFVDRSSYESDPLARCEWIRVYAEILGTPERGDSLYAEQKAYFDALKAAPFNADADDSARKTAVFFHITATGSFVTRKSGDYVSKMIELAGGRNVFAFSGDDNALSSVTVEAEEFCLRAKDADVIIYNGNTSGPVASIEELVSKNELLAGFRAVQNGDVWCTEDSLYQDIMKTGEILADFGAVFSGNGDGEALRYLRKLD